MEKQELFTNGKSNFLLSDALSYQTDANESGLEHKGVLERQQIHVLTISSTQPDKAHQRKTKADMSNIINLLQQQDKAVGYR